MKLELVLSRPVKKVRKGWTFFVMILISTLLCFSVAHKYRHINNQESSCQP